MATILEEFEVNLSPDDVWAAIRDIGAEAQLAPGFVVASRVEGDSRIVTFANGSVARERIVDCSDARRRLAYSIVHERLTHHNASLQVFDAAPGRSRVVWLADVLPDVAAATFDQSMAMGAAVMKGAFEARTGASTSV